ncbi:hypothetical protein [Granulicella arctica]|uniref:hypothetical protein n=1 Tax=Granulicella arctica TaxID=940613 RepID=UPI0021E046C1|nr:hypothetical protein [Granulicella arctica]
MAKELAKNGTKALAAKKFSVVAKHAKKAAKHAAKKHAKKAAKHATKHASEKTAGLKHSGAHGGIRTAFHHMQRASVVISLMEKGTGEDLRDLLDRGVKLYEHAIEGKGGDVTILRAVGVLRAAEHLSMAGLYAARHKHRQKVEAPSGPWLKGFMAETSERLKQVEDGERSKGPDLFPVAEELVRQAEDADHDTHLAFELVMAADALCFALENGL